MKNIFVNIHLKKNQKIKIVKKIQKLILFGNFIKYKLIKKIKLVYSS